MTKKLYGVVMMAVIAMSVGQAWAEELPDRLMVRVGGFLVRNYDTTVRLDSTGAPLGTSIDFADTLGGDVTANVVRVDGYYRFNPKHRVDVAYYRIQREGSRRLDVEIQWGDKNFAINDTVNSELDTGVLKLAYTYSFYHNDDVELGVSLGLHTSILRASLSDSAGQSEAEGVTAPLPVIGFLMDYHITPRWTTILSTEYFFFNAFGATGLLSDTLLATEYRITRHLGVGLGLNHYANGLEIEGDNAVLLERSNFRGFLGYLAGYF